MTIPSDSFLKELQKSSQRRRQLSFENLEIKAQITDKIGQLSRRNLESSPPSESHFEAEFPENNVSYNLKALLVRDHVCQISLP